LTNLRTRVPNTPTFLARQIRALGEKLAATLPRVRKRSDDEAIHDMRVALRRLRVVLKLARPVFGRFHVDLIRASLTRVHRASGALRDEEVLVETLSSLSVRSLELRAWIARRARREKSLHAIVDARIRAGDLRRPLRMLDALVALPVAPKRRSDVRAFARIAVLHARRDVDDQRDASTDDAGALHELRIAYKRLRYTAEIFSGVLSLDLAALAEPAARFQKRLGAIHDLDVAHLVIVRARNLDARIRRNVIRAIANRRREEVDLYLCEQPPA
jgi:CHAD domain-containing protein